MNKQEHSFCIFTPSDHRSEAGEENMKKNQEMLLYYCGQLQSEWAQKKALAYLRILAEAEGCAMGTDTGGKHIQPGNQEKPIGETKRNLRERGQ